MKKNSNTILTLVTYSLLFTLAPCNYLYALDLSPQLELKNELVVRGLSYTRKQAAIHATVDYDFSDNVFVGAGGFASSSNKEIGLFNGINTYIGWFHSFENDSALQFSLEENYFFGNTSSAWSYTEVRGDYHFSSNASVSIMFSDDYLGRKSDAVLGEINWNNTLSDNLFLHAQAGYIHAGENELIGESWYASSGLSFSSESSWGTSLVLHYGSERLDQVTNENSAGLRFVLGLSYQF